MERKFLFNYDALDNYLNEQQKIQAEQIEK